MPRLSCRDLGADCDYVVEAETKEEVKRELLAHVAHAHKRRVKRMNADERAFLDIRIDQVLWTSTRRERTG